jgi:hypothetical protein
MLLLLLLSSLNSHELIEKELTVQVTSKRSCVCCSQLSGTNWAYVGPCASQALPLPPPLHPPFVSKSLTRDTKGAGVEEGGVAVGHLLPPVLWQNSPTALIHQICQRHLLHLMGHPSLERTPLSEPQSQRCPASQQRSLGGGGVTKERRWNLLGGGGGKGRKNACVIFWSTSSLRKTYKAIALESYPHLFWVIAIINTPVIRSSLKDWHSMKKECILARHSKTFQVRKIFQVRKTFHVRMIFWFHKTFQVRKFFDSARLFKSARFFDSAKMFMPARFFKSARFFMPAWFFKFASFSCPAWNLVSAWILSQN